MDSQPLRQASKVQPLFRQGEHEKVVVRTRIAAFRKQAPVTRRSDRSTGTHRNVLPAVGRETDRITRHRRTQVGFPQNFAGLLVKRAEIAFDVAAEYEAAT